MAKLENFLPAPIEEHQLPPPRPPRKDQDGVLWYRTASLFLWPPAPRSGWPPWNADFFLRSLWCCSTRVLSSWQDVHERLPLAPATCFHTQQAEEAPFQAGAMHLKCPVAEHIHSRWSVVCAFDSWNAVLDFLAQLRVKMHKLKPIYFPALRTCRILSMAVHLIPPERAQITICFHSASCNSPNFA